MTKKKKKKKPIWQFSYKYGLFIKEANKNFYFVNYL